MSIMKNQSDFNAVNMVLEEIRNKLLEKGNRRRDTEIKEIDAYARGYSSGVFDTLEMVETAEQQEQNAPEPRTNLDRIHTMSAEEMALWLSSRDRECGECLAADTCEDTHGIVCEDVFVKWLNSPAKEDNENA